MKTFTIIATLLLACSGSYDIQETAPATQVIAAAPVTVYCYCAERAWCSSLHEGSGVCPSYYGHAIECATNMCDCECEDQ